MPNNITVKDATGASVSVNTNDAVIAAINQLGSQATLASILAKLIAAPATQAKQDEIITAINALETSELGAATLAALDTLSAGTDRSGVTVAGAKDVMAANAARTGGAFQNVSDAAMYVNLAGATASATNGFLVPAGGGLNIVTNQKISVYCATAGKAYVALEF